MDSIRKYEENQEYYENLDKRTKEYKSYAEWKENYENTSEGLGDVVEKITEATGIKKAVEFIAGEDCGCDKRKEALNRLFPRRKPRCFEEDEYNYLTKLFMEKSTRISQRELLKIYNRVFRTNLKPTSCSACVKSWYNDLKKLYEKYE